jgi:hypothetical protein
MAHTPNARRDRLIIRELENETLVYDGQTTVDDIATRLADDFRQTVDPKVVWLALAQLRRRRLLLERVPRAATGLVRLSKRDKPRISRRELGLRLGQALVIALPLITTIVAPRPASAASCSPNCDVPPLAECCPTGCPCSGPLICCSGQCSAGTCT